MKKKITLAIVIALATLTACGSEPVADTTPVDTTVVETTVEEQVEEVIDEVTEPVEEVIEPEVEEQVEVTEEPTEEPSTEVVEEPNEEPIVEEPTYTVTYFAEPKVMYCQEFSNFRVKPEQGATVSYTKNTNATVTVVGTCTENGWYYTEDGAWTLASNLGDNEVVVATAPTTPSTTPTTPSTPANSGYPAQVQEMLNNGCVMDWEFIDKFGNPYYSVYNPSNGWYYDYGTHPSTGEFRLNMIFYVDPAVGQVLVMSYSPDFGEHWY